MANRRAAMREIREALRLHNEAGMLVLANPVQDNSIAETEIFEIQSYKLKSAIYMIVSWEEI